MYNVIINLADTINSIETNHITVTTIIIKYSTVMHNFTYTK
jgi:hypothetical protein